MNLLRGKTIRNENPIDVDCNNINQYYATLGEQLAPNSKREEPLWKGPSSIHDFVLKPISQNEVMYHLNQLENKSKADVLQIDSKLLYISRNAVCPSLTYLYNKSIQYGILPADWKMARVTPINKANLTGMNTVIIARYVLFLLFLRS